MSVTCATRTFWWEAGRPADAFVVPLGAVVFDLSALAASDGLLDGDLAPWAGLDDLVNSLYFEAVPMAVVGMGPRDWVEPLVRQLTGAGIVDVIVTPDDLPGPGREPDLYGHALWELGVGPEAALAVTSMPRGLRVARAAKLATLLVRSDYDGLSAAGCAAIHRRWWASR